MNALVDRVYNGLAMAAQNNPVLMGLERQYNAFVKPAIDQAISGVTAPGDAYTRGMTQDEMIRRGADLAMSLPAAGLASEPIAAGLGANVRSAAGKRAPFKFNWTPGGGSKVKKIGNTEITYGVGRDGTAELTLVRTTKGKRGEGSASAAVKQFLDEADAQGRQVHLTADPVDATTSKPRLERWYESLGFKKNKGKNKDFSTRAQYIRPPASSNTVSQGGAPVPTGGESEPSIGEMLGTILEL